MPKNCNLTQHFSLSEMSCTTHSELYAANFADAAAFVGPLTDLCKLLEMVRAKFGPISIHSGYRNAAVNAASGGSSTSQHIKGEAADFHCTNANLENVYRWIVQDSGIAFGQCILERIPNPTWIHLSLGVPYRPINACGQALTFDGKMYRAW